jgi:hypothetical protein
MLISSFESVDVKGLDGPFSNMGRIEVKGNPRVVLIYYTALFLGEVARCIGTGNLRGSKCVIISSHRLL